MCETDKIFIKNLLTDCCVVFSLPPCIIGGGGRAGGGPTFRSIRERPCGPPSG